MTAHLSQGNSERTMEVLVLGTENVDLSVPVGLSSICHVPAICCKRYLNSIAARRLLLSGIWGRKELS